MFYIDQRPFQAEVHELIDTAYDDHPADDRAPYRDKEHCVVSLESRIRDLCTEHRINITKDDYAKHIVKLITFSNQGRAHKLVNAIGDKGLSRFGEFAVLSIFIMIKLTLLAAFVVFVVWTYGKIAG